MMFIHENWSKEGDERIDECRYYHREWVFVNHDYITWIFCALDQSNKAATYDSRVMSLRQNSNAVIEIYHEGKTLGSVLCGPVYAHGCALMVCIHIYDVKKNPSGRTGYPENHWDSFFVSPKCGKRMDLTSRIQVQWDWIWSRWQVSVPAVNWPLDPSELSGLFIKTPCKIL
jgi:hypothetical protein